MAFLANRTETERFVARRIDRDGAAGLAVLEFEFGFEFFAEFHAGRKRPAHLAPESFERADFAFFQ